MQYVACCIVWQAVLLQVLWGGGLYSIVVRLNFICFVDLRINSDYFPIQQACQTEGPPRATWVTFELS
jgi:hypothetical protein